MDRTAGVLTRAVLAAAALIAPGAHADPAAWRVTSSAGGELWLLGSVHYLRDSDYPLPPIVDELYELADAIVMELDLDDLDAAESESAFASAGLLPQGTRLREELAPDVYRLAERRAREFGYDLKLLDRFEPWLVAVTLLDLGMRERGFSSASGVEQYLLGKAAADGKEILGLETLETQIAVFDGLPASEQEALLEQTLLELESPDVVLADMIDAWRDGRLDELASRLTREFDGFPTLYDALVAHRNEAWIGELARLADGGNTHLVVVGALHLVGERSVVDLLRERGLDVDTLETPLDRTESAPPAPNVEVGR